MTDRSGRRLGIYICAARPGQFKLSVPQPNGEIAEELTGQNARKGTYGEPVVLIASVDVHDPVSAITACHKLYKAEGSGAWCEATLPQLKAVITQFNNPAEVD